MKIQIITEDAGQDLTIQDDIKNGIIIMIQRGSEVKMIHADVL